MKRFLWAFLAASWPAWLGLVALAIAQVSDGLGALAGAFVLGAVAADVLTTCRRWRAKLRGE